MAADLTSLFDLVERGDDVFVGATPPGPPHRVFGGLVVSQALLAAERTTTRPAHSLHAYFVLPGTAGEPIEYRVSRIRDGGSFSTRQVSAMQDGRTIFTMVASFHAPEKGFEHATPMPPTPSPETLPSVEAVRAAYADEMTPALRSYLARERPIEFRPVDLGRYLPRMRSAGARRDVWLRSARPLGEDPALHRASLAYMSDMTLLDACLTEHGASVFNKDIQAASLDHALWFHAPVRADEWLLYVQDSPFAGSGRGLARGVIFTANGQLVASVAQEGLIRPVGG